MITGERGFEGKTGPPGPPGPMSVGYTSDEGDLMGSGFGSNTGILYIIQPLLKYHTYIHTHSM